MLIGGCLCGGVYVRVCVCECLYVCVSVYVCVLGNESIGGEVSSR